MNMSLASDPIKPVLSDLHLKALDRRVSIILQRIRECVLSSGQPEKVIFYSEDQYDNIKPDQSIDDGHFFK